MPRARPQRIAIVWDASASGATRDHAREFALLDAYFRHLGEVEVLLQPVRDSADPVERYHVANGNWAALRQRLDNLPYDGATRLGAMRAPAEAALALLFSDGIGNWGELPLPAQPVPTFAFSATAGANANALRQMAEASGGGHVDLLSAPTADALATLTTESPRLLQVSGEGAADFEVASRRAEAGRIALAGRLTAPVAHLVVTLALPDGSRSTRKLRIDNGSHPAQGLAAHRWAALRLARLEADGPRQRAAIRRLGQTFRIATRETSLIVLDSAADYARYDIEPPAALRMEWLMLVTHRSAIDASARARHLDRIAAQFADEIAWWEKDFPKDAPPPPPPARESSRDAAMRAVPAPAPMAVAAPAPAAAETAAQPAATGIQLRKWQPDEPYARRLREARPEDLYAIYLDERPSYAKSTAFFLDVADLMYARGQHALATRVLSNLAKMDLDNRHVLRILAYRLLQADEIEAALPLLEQVRTLSPDEPQSWRDLGLALARAGQPQRAFELLAEVVSRPWNGRFPGVELIALAELNAIAAHAASEGAPLDTGAIDARLLRNLPLDLRAVLAWDADNTDIDLWVIDPNGERAYYGNRLTYQGGRMSADFTGGYGPEAFSLRRAKPGTYTVKAQFYGHRQQIVAPATTLMLRLTTGFGTPRQKDEDVVLRLSGRGDQVTVGHFTVPDTPAE